MPKFELSQDVTEYGLAKVLKGLGLQVPKKTRDSLLSLSHRTRREKIKAMLLSSESEHAPRPIVTRPKAVGDVERVSIAGMDYKLTDMIMGLTSGLTYVVAAINATGMVAIRHISDDSFKVKFYASEKDMGFTQEQLNAMGGHTFLRRNQQHFVYLRCFVSLDALISLFTLLHGMRGTTTIGPRCSMQKLLPNGVSSGMENKFSSFELALKTPELKTVRKKTVKKAIKKSVKKVVKKKVIKKPVKSKVVKRKTDSANHA